MTVRPRSVRSRSAGRVLDDAPPVKAVETFEKFYERELRSVVGLAYVLSGSRVAAEDLAQDAFLADHKQWDRVSRYEKPSAWVRRVVANMSVSMFRKKMTEAKALARMRPEQSYLPELPSESDGFWKVVRGLPKRQSQAVALHYLEGLSMREISEIIECSPNTVKVHLHKGRKTLALKLGVEGGFS